MIYQLKITLSGSRPPIWRRVEVEGSISLGQLHWVIQIAMGWTNSHLHRFIANGTSYGMVDPELDDWGMEMSDENEIAFEQIAPEVGLKIIYEYDFGDGWEHIIQVEQIKEPEPDIFYPICLAGKRACPPEDVGGIWGYEDFLKALQDRNHPEHEEYLQWIGGRADMQRYFCVTLPSVNNMLKTLEKRGLISRIPRQPRSIKLLLLREELPDLE